MLLWIGQRSSVFAVLGLGLLAACGPDPASTAQRWRVQHHKIPCVGEGPRLCYLVERGHGQPEFFYDEIEGFEYRWGFSHDISVTSSTQPATADGSTLRYRQVALIERRRAPQDATFSLPLTLDGQVLIEVEQGGCTLLGAVEIAVDAPGCDALRSRESAIFKHHATEPKLVPVSDPPG